MEFTDYLDNTSTTKVNPDELPDEEFELAEENKEKLLEEIKSTMEREEENDSQTRTGENFLDNIERFKLYRTGTVEVHFKRQEQIDLFIIHDLEARTVDTNRNYICFQ